MNGQDNNHYQDRVLQCKDCGADFVFTAGEQYFFNNKRPPLQPPKRCPACRERRKRTINPGMTWDSAVERANVAYDTVHNSHKGVVE